MKLKITFIAIVFIAFCFTTKAQVATWTGPTTGDWDTPANWSTSLTPLSGDSVSIPAGNTVTLTSDAGTINRLSVAGKLVIDPSGSLIVDQTTLPNGAAIVTLAGGEIDNNGIFTVKNDVATATNTLIMFGDNATRDNMLANTGILTIDNTVGAYASTTGRAINLSMVTAGRTSTFKMGGTININIKPTGVFIESYNGGNLTLDGKLVLGSKSDYKNLRFIKVVSGAKVTIAPTADITVYSGFVSSNGVIQMQSGGTVAPGATFTNYGKIALHGGPATTGYGILINSTIPLCYNTFVNAGTISIDGTYPLGYLFVGGSAPSGVSTITNQATGTISLYNTDPSAQVIQTAAATNNLTLTNAGILNVSSSAINLNSTIAVLTSTGTIVYNYIAGVQPLNAVNGKIFSVGQNIVVDLAKAEKGQIQLSDVTGKVLKTIYIDGERNLINTANLKGVFIIRLLISTGSYSEKICLN